MSTWRDVETKIVYHWCGGRIEVRQVMNRSKPLYQQRGWDAIERVVGGQCPGCQQVIERADLIDLTVPPFGGRGPALKAFQRTRKQARKKAAQQTVAELAVETPIVPDGKGSAETPH